MAKTCKPHGAKLECFDYRKYLIAYDYHNKCKGATGRSFKSIFPSSYHFLYASSTFWLWYDLLLTTEEQRKQVNFIKHWEMAKLVDEAIAVCAKLHSLAGENEKINNFKEPCDFILEVGRDTYKSTIARAGLIRVLGRYPEWTNAYIRSRAPDAFDGLRFITSHLLNNNELRKYFPRTLAIDKKEIKKKQLQFSRHAIDLAVSPEYEEEEVEYAVKRTFDTDPSLQAIGLDETYTGRHKHGLVVIDDAVTEKNYASKQIQDRIVGRLAELSIVASWQCSFIYAQTPYTEYDAFSRRKATLRILQEEEDRNKSNVKIYRHYFQPILELKDETGKHIDPEILLNYIIQPKNKTEYNLGVKSIVFPQRHNPRKIKRMYHDSPSRRFFLSQFLLKMVSDTDRLFKDEWLTFYGDNTAAGRQPAREDMRIITIIDPSGNRQDMKSDETGVLVVGIDDNSVIWVLEAIQRRFSDKGLIDMICGIYDIFRPNEWYMESFAAENKYKNLIQQILNYQGYRISIQSIKGKQNAGAKYDRIESAALPFEMRRIYVHERQSDLLRQYTEWRRPTPAGLPDHLLDALGYLTQMIFPSAGNSEIGYGTKFDNRQIESAFDLAPYMVQAIREKKKQESKWQKALCPQCYEMRPASDAICLECGSELLFGLGAESAPTISVEN